MIPRAAAVLALAVLAWPAAPARADGPAVTAFGSLGFPKLGDLNGDIRGLAAYYRDRATPPSTFTGSFKELKALAGGGLVVSFPLGPRFSLGVAAEYLTGARSGTLEGVTAISTSDSPAPGETRTVDMRETFSRLPRYALSVVPVTLLATYSIRLSPAFRLGLGAGAGAAFGRLTRSDVYEDAVLTDEIRTAGGQATRFINNYRVSGEATETSTGMGFVAVARAEVEFRIVKSLGLVAEGAWRSGRLTGWKGSRLDRSTWTHTWGEDGRSSAAGTTTVNEDGELWYAEFEDAGTGRFYERLSFDADRPAGSGFRNVRGASIDLDGLAFRLGLRFTF
jgi:hypothetical protein